MIQYIHTFPKSINCVKEKLKKIDKVCVYMYCVCVCIVHYLLFNGNKSFNHLIMLNLIIKQIFILNIKQQFKHQSSVAFSNKIVLNTKS